jgi:hypothetical protein
VAEDPPWEDDSGSPRVLRDYKADINVAYKAGLVLAELKVRPGETVDRRHLNCWDKQTDYQPYWYECDVRYEPSGRHRLFQIVQRTGTQGFYLKRDLPWRRVDSMARR